MSPTTRPTPLRLRPGDWVQVKSEAAIAATLDADGTLDRLPFMPEMRAFCGRHFRVAARADRTVHDKLGVRRMEDAVHLEELRCDGRAHDGCCRGCLLFWKEAWLERAPLPEPATPGGPASLPLKTHADGGYFCQATELERATRRLAHFDLRRDVRAPAAEGLSPVVLVQSLGILAYDILQRRIGGKEWNDLRGPCSRTPAETLALQPGERVRVKAWPDIAATLDRRGLNRGMEFSREMLDYCGRQLTVLHRVERLILDRAPTMIHMTDTVILDGAVYRALNRRAVPRREYMFWRECWLVRS